MEVVSRHGFDATIEEISQCCGVSKRTIFRHYASHDALMLVTVRAMFDACGGRVEGPSPVKDMDGWLEHLARTIHSRNAEIMGEAFWDIHAAIHRSSPVRREVAALRGEYRRRGIGYLTRVAWRAAGGTGEPPDDLVSAFALLFSGFTTHALIVDFDRTTEQIGTLSADILKVFLSRSVEAQMHGVTGSTSPADPTSNSESPGTG